MPKTKDLSRTTSKWAQNAGQATGSYQEGVQAPKADWATATNAAAENYKSAVTKAATEGRFQRGVTRVGSQKQQQNALSKGVQRYSSGVAAAQSDYQASMGPVLKTIEGVVLPPRKPKGDPSNYERSVKVGQALNAMKKGGVK